MRTLGGLLTVACLAILAAAGGCGDDDDTADRDRIVGRGYTYALPDGWRDISEKTPDVPALEVAGIRPDTAVVGLPEGGFATNVNVIREGGLPPGITTSQYAEISIAVLRDPAASGFPPEFVEAIERIQPRDISEPSDSELSGEPAAAWDYTSTQEGRVLRIHQVASVVEDAGYTVTLTSLVDQEEEGLDTFEELIDSWRWSGAQS
jgi:hypothetical protein